MKKFIISILIMGLIFTAVICSQSKPASEDVSSFYKEMISTTNRYADKLETVKNSGEASKIIREYTSSRKALMEKGIAMQKKYPELDFHNDPALIEYEKSLEDATKHFSVTIAAAIRKYTNVQEFKDAIAKMKEIEKTEQK